MDEETSNLEKELIEASNRDKIALAVFWPLYNKYVEERHLSPYYNIRDAIETIEKIARYSYAVSDTLRKERLASFK